MKFFLTTNHNIIHPSSPFSFLFNFSHSLLLFSLNLHILSLHPASTFQKLFTTFLLFPLSPPLFLYFHSASHFKTPPTSITHLKKVCVTILRNTVLVFSLCVFQKIFIFLCFSFFSHGSEESKIIEIFIVFTFCFSLSLLLFFFYSHSNLSPFLALSSL